MKKKPQKDKSVVVPADLAEKCRGYVQCLILSARDEIVLRPEDILARDLELAMLDEIAAALGEESAP